MIFKNTWKDYVLMALFCGVLFFFMQLLLRNGVLASAIGGAFFGITFPAVIAIIANDGEKRAALIRQEIAKNHKITCDGVAKINDKPGWMFLCEDALVYYPNKNGNPLVISLGTIRDVTLGMNRIVLHADRAQYKFVVCKNKRWQAVILQNLNNRTV